MRSPSPEEIEELNNLNLLSNHWWPEEIGLSEEDLDALGTSYKSLQELGLDDDEIEALEALNDSPVEFSLDGLELTDEEIAYLNGLLCPPGTIKLEGAGCILRIPREDRWTFSWWRQATQLQGWRTAKINVHVK